MIAAFSGFITFAVLCSSCYSGDSDKLKAFKIYATSEKELDFYNHLKENTEKLGISIERPVRRLNSSYIFTIPDCNRNEILSKMRDYKILDYEVFNPRFWPSEEKHLQRSNFVAPFDSDVVTKAYLSYEEANDYIDKIAEKIRQANPRISVEIRNEGRSFQGRVIKSITIKHLMIPNNPVIFIDAGIHAREWHSRSMALHLLNKLSEEAELDTKGLLYKASFVIVPNVNPDGYEFSRMGDKMWRKTRKPVAKGCIGVDGNRNFDSHWFTGDRERDPCAEVYRGPTPFSEPETRVIRDIMWRLKECKMYISIHTYGNVIIYPYGYTTDPHPRKSQLHKIAQAGVDAVAAKKGEYFQAYQSGSNMYIAAGGSDDYAIDVVGIPFAFTFELGAEKDGFAVPVERLKSTLRDGYVAIRAMVLQALRM